MLALVAFIVVICIVAIAIITLIMLGVYAMCDAISQIQRGDF